MMSDERSKEKGQQGAGQQAAAGQGQRGEELGAYGRGATEGGRYADAGDSVREGAGPARADAGRAPAQQRSAAQPDRSAQNDIARAERSHVQEPAQAPEQPEPVRGLVDTLNPVGEGPGGGRFREGQSAIEAREQEHEAWLAPRITTWKQNSGAETIFGAGTEEEARARGL